MRGDRVRACAEATGRAGVILLGAAIPVSVALDNILIGLIALCWAIGGDWHGKVRAIRGNPLAVAAWLLFFLLCLGTAWPDGRAGVLMKYIDLLLIPAFIHFSREEKTRHLALLAFGTAACASIVVSYLAHLNLLADFSLLQRTPDNPTAFKNSITHNIIVALAAYLFVLQSLEATDRRRRIIYGLLAVLAAHNVIFMVFGRTGYLVVTALFTYIAIARFGKRGLLGVVVAGTVIFATAYWTSGTFHQRIDSAIGETATWNSAQPSATSVGLRLEWYANSLKLIRERPLTGYGTGSFPSIYAKAVEGSGMVATTNPHNEYLLIAIQTGLAGLAGLLFLWVQQWRFAAQLNRPFYRHLARGLVLTFAIGCLFNSLLIDHTEGLLFAWMSGLIFAATANGRNDSAENP